MDGCEEKRWSVMFQVLLKWLSESTPDTDLADGDLLQEPSVKDSNHEYEEHSSHPTHDEVENGLLKREGKKVFQENLTSQVRQL